MEPRQEEYKSRRIELRVPEPGARMAEGQGEAIPELLIDDAPVGYGQLPDGHYFLEDYAYDWRDDLMDLARRYIDYQADATETVRERRSEGE